MTSVSILGYSQLAEVMATAGKLTGGIASPSPSPRSLSAIFVLDASLYGAGTLSAGPSKLPFRGYGFL
jgi:hypothetical protein